MTPRHQQCAFIAEHRDRFGVAQICRVLFTAHVAPISPRTFYVWVVRPPSKRALLEAAITQIIPVNYEPTSIANARQYHESHVHQLTRFCLA